MTCNDQQLLDDLGEADMQNYAGRGGVWPWEVTLPRTAKFFISYQDDFNNNIVLLTSQNIFKLKTCKMTVFQIFAGYLAVCCYFNSFSSYTACVTDEIKLWLSLSAKQRRNSCSRPLNVYQDLSTCHDWLVKKYSQIPARRCLNLSFLHPCTSYLVNPNS